MISWCVTPQSLSDAEARENRAQYFVFGPRAGDLVEASARLAQIGQDKLF
jgi:hypothetical protein